MIDIITPSPTPIPPVASSNMLKRSRAVHDTSALEVEYTQVNRKRFRRDSSIRVINDSWQANRHGDGSKPSTRVQFCPFVRCKEIPIVSEGDKLDLFYSKKDYDNFATHEKRRRKTFLLTVRVIREQKRRLSSNQDPVSSHQVATLYHCILSQKSSTPKFSRGERNETATASAPACIHALAA